MPLRPAVRCHLFCRVVDNFGDAGVCWRLARQLSSEFGWQVRLFIDRADVLRRIAPEAGVETADRPASRVEIASWPNDSLVGEPGDVVIEAFACRLPDSYVRAMADRATAPVWINLEYLSAEDWVEDCHGLPSPDPSTGLVKHFFFPGYTRATGGLIRERGHEQMARSFESNDVRRSFLASLGVFGLSDADLPVSVFCYPDSPLPPLMALAERTAPAGRRPLWLLTEASAQHFPGIAAQWPGRIHIIPFLGQGDYDRLLLACELNFVRGEDSFVRAQLAARPFVWQAYRQSEETHRLKVDSFLDQYVADADHAMTTSVRGLFEAWNGFAPLDVAVWRRYSSAFPAIADHTLRWRHHLESTPNLAEQLVQFCERRL